MAQLSIQQEVQDYYYSALDSVVDIPSPYTWFDRGRHENLLLYTGVVEAVANDRETMDDFWPFVIVYSTSKRQCMLGPVYISVFCE